MEKINLYEYKIKRYKVGEVSGVQMNEPELLKRYAHSLFDWDCEQEQIYVILLDNSNKIKGHKMISLGTVSSTVIHPREVFRPAIIAGASSIVLTHNHPSGTLVPSDNDDRVTKMVREAGSLLAIPLLDHIIVVESGSWYSYHENRW